MYKIITSVFLLISLSASAQNYYEDEQMIYEDEAFMDEEASYDGVREPGGEFSDYHAIQEQEYDMNYDTGYEELYPAEDPYYAEEEIIP